MAGTSKSGQVKKRKQTNKQKEKQFLVKSQMYQPASLYNKYFYKKKWWKLNLGQEKNDELFLTVYQNR